MPVKRIFTKQEEQEIIKYYLTPFSLCQTAKHFKIYLNQIKRILEENNVPFHSKEVVDKLRVNLILETKKELYGDYKEIVAKCKATKLKRYGDANYCNTEKIKQTKLNKYGSENYNNIEKQNKTRLEKYGVRNFFQNKEIHDKALNKAKSEESKEKKKQTCLYHFGVEYSLQAKEVRERINSTIKEKYGVDNISLSEEIHNKKVQTSLSKYGVEYYTQTDESKQRHKETWKNKPTEEKQAKLDKMKATCLSKYGEEHYNKTEESKERHKKINEERTPEEWKAIIDKTISTKRERGTFNTSLPEERFYNSLLEIFDKSEIFRKYNDERYPFACDFYIKPLDLFIELNLFWSHGGHPYNNNDEKDKIILEEWKEKAKKSSFYKGCINTWTKSDPLKIKTAKENNLNYTVVYSEKELEKILNAIK